MKQNKWWVIRKTNLYVHRFFEVTNYRNSLMGRYAPFKGKGAEARGSCFHIAVLPLLAYIPARWILC